MVWWRKFTVFDQRQQAKLQWFQDPNQSTLGNLNNVRREASRHFWNTKKEYLKAKIDKLENNGKIKNIREMYRGIDDFTKGYQSRTNGAKDCCRLPTVFWLGGGAFSLSH